MQKWLIQKSNGVVHPFSKTLEKNEKYRVFDGDYGDAVTTGSYMATHEGNLPTTEMMDQMTGVQGENFVVVNDKERIVSLIRALDPNDITGDIPEYSVVAALLDDDESLDPDAFCDVIMEEYAVLPEGIEDDVFRGKVLDTLINLLDPENDEHWTQAGLPEMDAIKEISGLPNVSRTFVSDLIDGFDRERAYALHGIERSE